ncbi:MAG: hypothetical protein NC319_07325 [Butyricicoccus sp.]|nr:hypothetical protein [Butyricicoccus sp.]
MDGKRWKILALLLCALLLAGCGQQLSAQDLAGKTYVYEKPGFGGDFTVTLDADGGFTCYEGGLSSYIGAGDWELDGGTLVLRDTAIPSDPKTYRFRVQDGALAFLAGESDEFLFVQPAEGELFSPRA